ncbi:MAG TPA: dihydrofolate reductase family protein [Cyclobacteriaceae bacterium]|nr:dihydrofolate reductase family protein [Cyclobacteriaceae bacterium]
MRKLILCAAVSLDGLIEGPNGEYDWCFTDQDYGLSDFFKQIDAIFMGRKSYELAQSMEGQNPWEGTRTYVFSNTLKSVSKNGILVSGEIAKQVAEIKQQQGKDIWLFGGASLTASLLNAGLVDEFWLAVHPIVLGAGKPMFSSINRRIKTKLFETKSYETGLVSLKYQVLHL